MLSGLDEIDWASLTHAYGSAADVPELLRKLRDVPANASGTEGDPVWELFGNIWHQGTVYEATAHAVPFLLELASDQFTPRRAELLSLLACIAGGASYRDVHGNNLGEADFDQKRNTELGWAAAANAAIGAAADRLLELTFDPDASVRLCAAQTLSRLAKPGSNIYARVSAMSVAEPDALHRAGLLLMVPRLGDHASEARSVLVSTISRGSTVERVAAALALVRLDGSEAPSAAGDIVRDYADREDDVYEMFSELPFDIGAVGELAEALALIDD